MEREQLIFFGPHGFVQYACLIEQVCVLSAEKRPCLFGQCGLTS